MTSYEFSSYVRRNAAAAAAKSIIQQVARTAQLDGRSGCRKLDEKVITGEVIKTGNWMYGFFIDCEKVPAYVERETLRLLSATTRVRITKHRAAQTSEGRRPRYVEVEINSIL